MDLRELKEFIKDSFKYILLVLIVLLTFLYVLAFQQILGPSMQPNLKADDVVILNKIKYRFSNIKRFDIVALDYKDSKYLVKRVIGLPGDRIEYRNNILYVNDQAVEETFLGDNITTDDFSLKDIGYDVIPDGMYLVLGDNRGNSMDGRDFGLIKKSQIKGKVSIRIWPIGKLKFFEIF